MLVLKSEEWRCKGNESFRSREFRSAFTHYTTGLHALDDASSGSHSKDDLDALQSKLLSNRAACGLELGWNAQALEDAQVRQPFVHSW